MRKMIVMLALVLTVALINLAQPRCVWACDCAFPSVSEASNAAAAVFVGEVTAIVPSLQETSSADPVAVTFDVSRVWKGDAQPTITVITARWEPSCGYEFEEGQEYLVYARTVDATLAPKQPANIVLQTGLCSRTQPLADAADDLAVLGDGQAPATGTAQTVQPTVLPNTAGETEAPVLNLQPIVALGALGVVAAGFAGCIVRKRLL